MRDQQMQPGFCSRTLVLRPIESFLLEFCPMGSLLPFYLVSGQVSPLDALEIINRLAVEQSDPNAESEAVGETFDRSALLV